MRLLKKQTKKHNKNHIEAQQKCKNLRMTQSHNKTFKKI